ncbi:MAG: O-antigen ligase family protein [Caldilineaceae bacterium]|nr:O-antigen ligase family protein [Caldilineaceae bacterium]
MLHSNVETGRRRWRVVQCRRPVARRSSISACACAMSQTVHYPTDRPLRGQTSVERFWPPFLEFALLALAAPLLYFPDRVRAQVADLCSCETGWIVPAALVLLALLWPLRRWTLGRWAAAIPMAWALWFWFLVMLPVAIWAAPPPLREQYAWPRALILVWNFSLFWSVLAHASYQRRGLGWAFTGWIAAVQAIALLAPFGMEARAKLPGIGDIQDAIPRPLLGLFSGAEAGFSTNQVAGVLLYVLPLLMALCVVGLRWRGWRWWLLLLCTIWMGATMLLTQSRGGLLGLMIGVIAMLLLMRRWGWYALAALAVVGATVIFYLPPGLLGLISDAPGVDALGGVVTVQNFRTLVWGAATAALQDFFFTGMGLGTFRVLVYLLYPLPGVSPTYDLAHAHNFFLQTGLDFGVPGLVAILLLYGAAVVQLARLAHLPTQRPIWSQLPYLTPRVLAIGWMGCLVGQTFYSLFDVVAMGSKPNFVWWWWMALIFAAANTLLPSYSGEGIPPASE